MGALIQSVSVSTKTSFKFRDGTTIGLAIRYEGSPLERQILTSILKSSQGMLRTIYQDFQAMDLVQLRSFSPEPIRELSLRHESGLNISVSLSIPLTLLLSNSVETISLNKQTSSGLGGKKERDTSAQSNWSKHTV